MRHFFPEPRGFYFKKPRVFFRQILFLHMKTKAKFTGRRKNVTASLFFFLSFPSFLAWIAYVLLPFFLQHPIQRGTITYREENFQKRKYLMKSRDFVCATFWKNLLIAIRKISKL